MYWNRSAADIAAAWQTEIESKLEIGARALLLGGVPDTMLPSAPALLGLQESAIQRNDIATPMLVAGGNSAYWLGLLLPPQPTGSARNAPTPTLVYGGADEATYLAVVGLMTAVAAQPHSATSAHKSSSPLEMGGQFAPRLQPGVATQWEMLPLIEVGEQPIVHSPTSTISDVAGDPTGEWIVWGVMLLTLCLVLSAFLI